MTRRLLALAFFSAPLFAGPALAQERATFLFEWDGFPVGTVELELDLKEGHYQYTSTHAFTRDGEITWRRRSDAYAMDAKGRDPDTGRFWESLWLWRGPRGPGCVRGRAEQEARTGDLCVKARHGDELTGAVFGRPFVARLGEGDQLQEVKVGAARFRRVEGGAKVAAPPDVLDRRFRVGGFTAGILRLRPAGLGRTVPLPEPVGAGAFRPAPSAEAARRLSARVETSFTTQAPSAADFRHDEEAASAGCLGHARRFAEWAKAGGFDALIVHGLHVSPGDRTAAPHAWVRVRLVEGGWLDLDPTLGGEVVPQTHLPLGFEGPNAPARVGDLWLQLFRGEWEVVRLRPPSGATPARRPGAARPGPRDG